MSQPENSVFAYFDGLKRTTPAWLHLLTAETEAEFEAAFLVVLQFAIRHMETNARNFLNLGEVGLSGVLAGSLSIPDVMVARQEMNSNGHVDLTIEAYCNPPRTKLGEAKIYSVPSKYIDGVKQLLGRYATGRESSGLLLNYVRQPDINGITDKLKSAMELRSYLRSKLGPARSTRWSGAS